MKLPHRISGSLALDFANTISWRGTSRQADLLVNAAGLSAWAAGSGLATSAPDRTEMKEARALRDAIGAVGAAFARREPPPPEALLRLRDTASHALARAELTGDPLRPRFAADDGFLGAVAWSALELFGGPETSRIRECPFDDCRWLFVDRSKNGSRRWCEMATCGNRAKKIAIAASRGNRPEAD